MSACKQKVAANDIGQSANLSAAAQVAVYTRHHWDATPNGELSREHCRCQPFQLSTTLPLTLGQHPLSKVVPGFDSNRLPRAKSDQPARRRPAHTRPTPACRRDRSRPGNLSGTSAELGFVKPELGDLSSNFEGLREHPGWMVLNASWTGPSVARLACECQQGVSNRREGDKPEFGELPMALWIKRARLCYSRAWCGQG